MDSLSATDIKASHGQSIGLSIVMILAGVLAIAAPLVAGISTVIWIAWLLVASGAAHLAYGWHARGHGRLFLEVLISAIYGIAALFLLFNPLAGLASLTFVLVFYFFAAGAVEIFAAFRLHSREGSGWLYLDGIVTLILAFMIWNAWPSSSVWATGTLVGVGMLCSGVTRLMLSMATRTAMPA